MSAARRVVLITGCSSGIGKATARHLNGAGWTVIATARRTTDLADLAAAGCRTLALDVADEGSRVAAVRTIEAEHGAIDALVNNAGYSQSGAFEAVPLERARAQFETNLFGPAHLTQLVLSGMRRARAGRIVNISSMGGRLTFPGGAYYHASKYALEGLTDVLRWEMASFGIATVLIEPGLIRSRFGETVAAHLAARPEVGSTYDAFHALVSRLTQETYTHGPLAKLGGTPEDVARVVERALTAKRPRARYTVTPSAWLLITLRRLLGDRGWDAFLSASYPGPGALGSASARMRSK